VTWSNQIANEPFSDRVMPANAGAREAVQRSMSVSQLCGYRLLTIQQSSQTGGNDDFLNLCSGSLTKDIEGPLDCALSARQREKGIWIMNTHVKRIIDGCLSWQRRSDMDDRMNTYASVDEHRILI
jgi:hypothetical protein